LTRRASDLLLTPLFLVALTAWAFNDHVLRRIAPGVLSGKLGDAASMVVFPILVAATFAPLARRLRVDERHLVDAAALGTALLLAAIQFHHGVAHAYQWALGTVQYALGWSSYHVLAAHTMDPTDALVTPLAILPALAIRGVRLAELVRRRSLPLAGLVTLVAVSGCGGHAWAGHADLRLHAGATENVQFDRDGEPVGEHRAGVAGASADVQLRVRKRAVLGGIAATASGWVPHIEDDYARYGAYSDRYQALSLAPTVTLLGDNVVIRAGAGLTLATGRGQQVDAFRPSPLGSCASSPVVHGAWFTPSSRWAPRTGSCGTPASSPAVRRSLSRAVTWRSVWPGARASAPRCTAHASRRGRSRPAAARWWTSTRGSSSRCASPHARACS
jgi:hypothetical protein